VDAFSGNARLPGAEPTAMLYAGHQFGGWVPQLGDGRAAPLCGCPRITRIRGHPHRHQRASAIVGVARPRSRPFAACASAFAASLTTTAMPKNSCVTPSYAW
jgi:hypothetical protein